MNLPQCISTKLTAGLLAAVTMITPAFAVTGTVNADGGLRMRNAAGTDAGIITTLPNGSVIDVTAVTENGWYQISSGSVTGYVKAEYCVTGEEANVLAKEIGLRIATVTTTTLKVRQEPSMEASVLGLVPIEDEEILQRAFDEFVKRDEEAAKGE